MIKLFHFVQFLLKVKYTFDKSNSESFCTQGRIALDFSIFNQFTTAQNLFHNLLKCIFIPSRELHYVFSEMFQKLILLSIIFLSPCGLDIMICSDAFQSLQFCDSVILSSTLQLTQSTEIRFVLLSLNYNGKFLKKHSLCVVMVQSTQNITFKS